MQEDSHDLVDALVELLAFQPGRDMEKTLCTCIGNAMLAGDAVQKRSGYAFQKYTVLADELFNVVMQLKPDLHEGTMINAVILHLRLLFAIATHKPHTCVPMVPDLLDLSDRFSGPQYVYMQLIILDLILLLLESKETRDAVCAQ